MKVFDADGKEIEVPDDQVGDLYRAGKIGFRAGARVPISDGQRFGTVPVEQLDAAIEGGWKVDPAGVDQVQYGTPGQQAIAGLEGLAGGATLGASELLEKGLGVSPEGIEGRARANPFTHGAGEVVGAIAPAVIGAATANPELDAAAAAEAAPEVGSALGGLRGLVGNLPAGLVAKGGGALERAFLEGEAPADALTKLGGAILRGGAETAAFGGADEARRQLLEGDDASIPVRAQKILSAAGTAALFGGGVSGVFHIAGALASGATRKALGAFAPDAAAPAISRGALEDAVGAITTQAEEDPTTFGGKLLASIIGKDKLAAVRRLAGSAEARTLARTAESDANRQYIDATEAISNMFSGIDDASRTIAQAVKPKEIDQALAAVDPSVPRAKAWEIAQAMRARVAEMRAAPADFSGSSRIDQLERQAEKLEKVLGVEMRDAPVIDSAGYPMVGLDNEPIMQPQPALSDRKIPTAKELWEVLDQTKRNLEDISRVGEAIAQTERPAARVAGDFRVALRDLLTDEGAFGQAAAAQGRYNALIGDWISAKEPFEEYFGRRVGFRDGQPVYRIEAGKVESFFKSLGEPGNEGAKKAFTDMMAAAHGISTSLGEDSGVQEQLATAFGQTAKTAKLSRALADLRRVKAKTESVQGLLSSPLGRALLGGLYIGPRFGALVGGAPFAGATLFSFFDQLASRNTARLDALAESIAKGLRPVSNRAPVAALKVLQQISFTGHAPRKGEDRQEAFARIRGELGTLAADPGRAEQLLRARVAPIGAQAPKHAEAMVQQGMRAISFLASELPPPPPRSPLRAATSRPAVPDSDIDRFTATLKVVMDPMSALEDLAHGRLTAVGARALRTTNPELAHEMQAAIVRAAQNRGKDVPYETRLQLSVLFDAPLDPSLLPTSIAGCQASYGPPAATPQQETPLRSTKELKSIQNAATAAQRLAQKEA